MGAGLLFIVNASLFFVHELDAVRRSEWRMLFALNRLADETAYRVFILLHLPLFGLLLWFLAQPEGSHRFWFAVIFDGFLVFHLGLHLAFTRHPANGFKSLFSFAVIVAMAVGGGLHALLILADLLANLNV